jgi:hypothetical protein
VGRFRTDLTVVIPNAQRRDLGLLFAASFATLSDREGAPETSRQLARIRKMLWLQKIGAREISRFGCLIGNRDVSLGKNRNVPIAGYVRMDGNWCANAHRR